MAKLSDMSSELFSPSYPVCVRVVMCADVVHRKNLSFAREALMKSGFAKYVVNLIDQLPADCVKQIVNNVEAGSIDLFAKNFLDTNCRHYVNKHDEKMCTVEFSFKFLSTVEVISRLPETIVENMHLEIKTPVGDVQL